MRCLLGQETLRIQRGHSDHLFRNTSGLNLREIGGPPTCSHYSLSDVQLVVATFILFTACSYVVMSCTSCSLSLVYVCCCPSSQISINFFVVV